MGPSDAGAASRACIAPSPPQTRACHASDAGRSASSSTWSSATTANSRPSAATRRCRSSTPRHGARQCWPDRAESKAGPGEYAFAAIDSTSMPRTIRAALLSVRTSPAARSGDDGGRTSSAGLPRRRPRQPERSTAADARRAYASRWGTRAPGKRPAQSVRIDVERLDGLMNLVGELVIDRTRLQQIRAQLGDVLKDANLNELTRRTSKRRRSPRPHHR